MSERDGAWMARILAGFSEATLELLVKEGHFAEPVLEAELARILIGRRKRILERYLGPRSD